MCMSDKPYQTTVNNGYVIETDDSNLIEQLKENENNRSSDVIDWYLFKVGNTILIDDNGIRYGCIQQTDSYKITLIRIA